MYMHGLVACLACACADRTISEVQPVQCSRGLLFSLDFQRRTDVACIAEIDVEAAGAQYCTISDVQHYGSPIQAEQVLVECHDTATNVPCWRIVSDPQNCVAADHLAVTIDRGGMPPPDDNQIIGYCVRCTL